MANINSASSNHFVVIAGEASGDMHAAHLVDEIRKRLPGATFSGLGGPRMATGGVDCYADLTTMAVVGFVEVIKHYREFKNYFDLVLRKVTETQARAVILVDYPGFNLRLAKELKKMNVPVFYYISPQVWAWKENRVRAIRDHVERMLVLFRFEKDFYARRGVEVTFVGHPLADTVRPTRPPDETLTALGLDPKKKTIGLLPGSRMKEIEKMMPVMAEAAGILNKKYPDLQFLLIKAPSIPTTALDSRQKHFLAGLKILDHDVYNGIDACDLCMVTSGTATLETALLLKPMVVVYRTSFLTWLLARLMIKIPNIALVNVVAQKRVVPECVQFEATGKRIAAELDKMIQDPSLVGTIEKELQQVKDSLGGPGASQRAAETIIACLKS